MNQDAVFWVIIKFIFIMFLKSAQNKKSSIWFNEKVNKGCCIRRVRDFIFDFIFMQTHIKFFGNCIKFFAVFTNITWRVNTNHYMVYIDFIWCFIDFLFLLYIEYFLYIYAKGIKGHILPR